MVRSAALEGLRLFLVEDDPLFRKYLCSFLESEGCLVTAFDSAEVALESLKEQSCDVIVCDYGLPGMDGLEFFRKVSRSHPPALRILVTGYGDVETFTTAWKTGVHEYIEKPFMAEMLQGVIQLHRRTGGLPLSSH